MDIRDYLNEHILLFDGAMGTYFSSVYPDPHYPCEYANITSPQTIREIHRRYLHSGAKAIKTNTFSLYTGETEEFSPVQLLRSGFALAKEVAEGFDAYVFCDIGPISAVGGEKLIPMYLEIVDEFIALGGVHFLFETFTEGETPNCLAQYIKERVPHAFIMASFAIDADGFTHEGHLGTTLLEHTCDAIDCAGFNCICGPHHMKSHTKHNVGYGKPLSIMPNASYPTVIGQRVRYENNPQYFAHQMMDIVGEGAQIIGGCCGTTPQFIQAVHEMLAQQGQLRDTAVQSSRPDSNPVIRQSDFYQKLTSGQRPIAVELDSPLDADVKQFMAGAVTLRDAGVDMITIADCPVARARMDSSLLACKVRREVQIPVMPHMTCRDRNTNATRALLLGLAVEDITDVLLVTGDPIPTAQRSEVKAVYEFNSRMLINHIAGLNQSVFHSPFYLYAALNLNARNFDIQLDLAQKKIERGAMAFFTQPVLCDRALENLKRAKETLNVPIAGGILPIVSHRNAVFINNEIPGITVSDDIVSKYEGQSKEVCTQLAVDLSVDIAKKMAPYIDGHYLITPFKRVDIIAKIIKGLK